ncbi:flavanone 7-o-glucoside 2''-o-beta-l-rhamnosyltransferase [Quercus suber]|uniref:Flavanone 7-o-glucoside 2''-o-beta-l-rhamnosyltransferase n=1 Tax=Quercus suber TaxID=58331 RepID=A0AAW0LPT8_QUESU
MAFDMASPSFSNMLKTLKPDLVIYDFLQPWAPSIAYTHNIPAVKLHNYWSCHDLFCASCHEKPRLTNSLEGSSTVHPYINDKERILQSFARSSNIVLIKTFRELEGKYIDLLSSLIEKKVVPVGPLVEDPVHEDEKAKTID